MALNLRERFGPKDTPPQLSLSADFRFDPADYPSLREHRVEQAEVDVLEKPLTVDRRYFLTAGSVSLRLEFALCLEGAGAVVDLLFRRAGAFQREPSGEAVVDLAGVSIGQVGVAWPWDQKGQDGVAGFVRHNVLVFLQGSYGSLIEQARDLDAALARLPFGAGASERSEASFDLGGRESGLQVAPGGRIDLGPPVQPSARHFFIASGGSVNRDPREPDRYYFRAGLEKGRQLVTVLRVGPGLLPARQTITVTIT